MEHPSLNCLFLLSLIVNELVYYSPNMVDTQPLKPYQSLQKFAIKTEADFLNPHLLKEKSWQW